MNGNTAPAPPAAPPLLSYWTIQTSRSTGRRYYFNSKTGASLYEEPPDVTQARIAGRLPPHLAGGLGNAPVSAPSTATSKPMSSAAIAPSVSSQPLQQPSNAATTIAIASAGSSASNASVHGTERVQTETPPGIFSPNPVEFRDAVEVICKRLLDGGPNGPDRGYFYLPPCDKPLRIMVHEMAEEYDIKSFSGEWHCVGLH